MPTNVERFVTDLPDEAFFALGLWFCIDHFDTLDLPANRFEQTADHQPRVGGTLTQVVSIAEGDVRVGPTIQANLFGGIEDGLVVIR